MPIPAMAQSEFCWVTAAVISTDLMNTLRAAVRWPWQWPDVNKDGWPDVVTADVHFSGVSVFYNTSASQPTPDFTVAANPTTVRVTPGGTVTTTISLSSVNAFVGSVQLACQNLPKTLTCAFTPSVVHVVKGKAVSSQLTIAASQSNSPIPGSAQSFWLWP